MDLCLRGNSEARLTLSWQNSLDLHHFKCCPYSKYTKPQRLHTSFKCVKNSLNVIRQIHDIFLWQAPKPFKF